MSVTNTAMPLSCPDGVRAHFLSPDPCSWELPFYFKTASNSVISLWYTAAFNTCSLADTHNAHSWPFTYTVTLPYTQGHPTSKKLTADLYCKTCLCGAHILLWRQRTPAQDPPSQVSLWQMLDSKIILGFFLLLQTSFQMKEPPRHDPGTNTAKSCSEGNAVSLTGWTPPTIQRFPVRFKGKQRAGIKHIKLEGTKSITNICNARPFFQQLCQNDFSWPKIYTSLTSKGSFLAITHRPAMHYWGDQVFLFTTGISPCPL